MGEAWTKTLGRSDEGGQICVFQFVSGSGETILCVDVIGKVSNP